MTHTHTHRHTDTHRHTPWVWLRHFKSKWLIKNCYRWPLRQKKTQGSLSSKLHLIIKQSIPLNATKKDAYIRHWIPDNLRHVKRSSKILADNIDHNPSQVNNVEVSNKTLLPPFPWKDKTLCMLLNCSLRYKTRSLKAMSIYSVIWLFFSFLEKKQKRWN